MTDEQKLAAEIERLRKQGSRLLQEEQQRIKEEIQKGVGKSNIIWDSSLNRIKIRWKASKTDEHNGGYNEENLKKFLKKYGKIIALIISPHKKGSALVEFATKEASEMAVELEKGIYCNLNILENFISHLSSHFCAVHCWNIDLQTNVLVLHSPHWPDALAKYSIFIIYTLE